MYMDKNGENEESWFRGKGLTEGCFFLQADVRASDGKLWAAVMRLRWSKEQGRARLQRACLKASALLLLRSDGGRLI